MLKYFRGLGATTIVAAGTLDESEPFEPVNRPCAAGIAVELF